MNMNATSILSGDLSALTGAEAPPSARQADHFAELVDRARKGLGSDEIRKAAEQLVSATFITPILSQVRESSQAAPPFAPTQGEKQFGAMLDQRIADEIVKSSRLPMVERLTREFSARAGLPVGQTLEVLA